MGEENESFYDNLVLESIRNNEEIRIENTPGTPLTGSIPYLPSENIVNTSENMENVRPVSVENSRAILENYIDEKYDQATIKYLKEKILNEVKQQFSPNNHVDKINAELVKSLREQIENIQSEISFFTRRNERKKYFIENDHSLKEFSTRNDSGFPYLQTVPV